MPDMPKIGKDCIDLVVAEAHIQDPAGVDLSSYQAIEPQGARHLASHLEGSLLLLGIHSICKESARELSSFQGRISMPELKQFDAETAEVIASFPGVTICNTTEGGKRIGELLGPLESAKANEVVDIAREISGVIHTGCYLSLTQAACRIITTITNPAFFGQVQSIDTECASILAGKKNMTFPHLRDLSLGTAEALLGANCETLNLPALREVTPDLIKAMVRGSVQFLNLSGITKLTEEMAGAFAARSKHMFFTLNGIRKLEADSARILMGFDKPFLAGETFSLIGLEEIGSELGELLTRYRGMYLNLNAETQMDDKIREALEAKTNIKLS